MNRSGADMGRFWMVRAGEGGYLADDFERAECVAIGWSNVGDMSSVATVDEMKTLVASAYPNEKPGARANSAAMAFKFRHEMSPGDGVVTYDVGRREYLVGRITGDYEYAPGRVPDYNNVRTVRWEARVGRDLLTTSSKNTLGSTLTLFEPGEAVLEDLLRAVESRIGASPPPQEEDEATGDFEVIRRDVVERAHEFIKDRLLALRPDDMELLVAGLLTAMGYRARVTRKGPDRGRDIIASPDGLGLQEPRIVAEVKHRQSAMGAQEIRSFVGALRPPTRGLYVSSGGFTKEAHYEAERASVPVTLVDLDELAVLITDHYETFDMESRALLPLVRIYWPG